MTKRDPHTPFTVTIDRYTPTIDQEDAQSFIYAIQRAMVKELTKKALNPIVNPSPLAMRYDTAAHFAIGAKVAQHILGENWYICRRPIERPHSWPPIDYNEPNPAPLPDEGE